MTEKQIRKIGQTVTKDLFKLTGQNWECRVYENLGWHVEWSHGAINLNYSLRKNIKARFWCMVTPIGENYGEPLFSPPAKNFTTPEAAILYACHFARKVHHEIVQPIINSVEDIEFSFKK